MYDDFLLERYGYNIIAKKLSEKIIDLININLGKLIYKKEIKIDSFLPENIFMMDLKTIKLD